MKKKIIHNIENIVKNSRCSGCGTCISLCPQGALELVLDNKNEIYIPKVDKDRCNNCEICQRVVMRHVTVKSM